MNLVRLGIVVGALGVAAWGQVTEAEYDALLVHFTGLRSQTTFPVNGYDDMSSTFGGRIRQSCACYDWHRGIDVSGTIGTPVVAPLDGIFWRYTTFASGGNTVILRHDFPQPVMLGGQSFDHFFTLNLHLFDDGILGNGMGTDDVIDGWVEQSTPVSRGQVIAELGDSGSVVTPHLHFELRVGTRFSHEYQLGNPPLHGFDPHMHPMLLFEPYAYPGTGPGQYENSITLTSMLAPASDLTFAMASSTDDMPLLNRFEVRILGPQSATLTEHVLDYNLRRGFDSTSTAALDTQELTLPYLEPVPFGPGPMDYETQLILPQVWLDAHQTWQLRGTTLQLGLFDIWKNETTLQIPVPSTCGDCDQDGDVDILDGLRAAQLAVTLLVATPDDDARCDVDADMDIDVLDALLTAQWSAGLPVTLHCP